MCERNEQNRHREWKCSNIVQSRSQWFMPMLAANEMVNVERNECMKCGGNRNNESSGPSHEEVILSNDSVVCRSTSNDSIHLIMLLSFEWTVSSAILHRHSLSSSASLIKFHQSLNMKIDFICYSFRFDTKSNDWPLCTRTEILYMICIILSAHKTHALWLYELFYQMETTKCCSRRHRMRVGAIHMFISLIDDQFVFNRLFFFLFSLASHSVQVVSNNDRKQNMKKRRGLICRHVIDMNWLSGSCCRCRVCLQFSFHE